MTDTQQSVAVVILAAGKGTRMKSDKAKVLHEINRIPMVNYVAASASEITGENMVVVIGHQAEKVRATVVQDYPAAKFAIQKEQLGTGHAAQCALSSIPDTVQHVVILCGDVPLIRSKTIRHLITEHIEANRDLTALAVNLDDPTGYGRILIGDENRVTGIIEEADATETQKKIKTVNAGIYCATRTFLSDSLGKIGSDNSQGEFYLTDVLEIGYNGGRNVGVLVWENSEEVLGINTVRELQVAENIVKNMFPETA